MRFTPSVFLWSSDRHENKLQFKNGLRFKMMQEKHIMVLIFENLSIFTKYKLHKPYIENSVTHVFKLYL